MSGNSRLLDPLERWYWVFGNVSPLNGVARCRFEGNLKTESVQHAIGVVQKRHPLLRSNIKLDKKNRNPRFEVQAEMNVEVIKERLEGKPNAWVEAVKQGYLNKPFNTSIGPLFKVVLFEYGGGTDLILIASHTIIDATGIMSLLKEIVLLAGDPTVKMDSYDLSASFSDRFPSQFNGLFAFLKTLCLQLKIELFSFLKKPIQLPIDKYVEFQDRRTNFIHKELSQDQTKSLVAACKAENTSVHAALCTALIFATLTDKLVKEKHAHRKNVSVGIGSPVNLREDLLPQVDDASLGIFVASFFTFASKVDQKAFWDVARDFRNDMLIQKENNEPFTIMNFVRRTMPHTAETAGSYMKFLDGKGPGNLCISNLGAYDFPDHSGEHQISGAQFIAETSVTGLWVSTANTSHNQLFWNFSYTKDMVSDDRATSLANACIKILLEYTRAH